MHSDEHTLTQPISATLAVMHAVKTQLLPEGLQRVLPAPPARPLHVQAVASAIVDCAEHSLLASAAGRAGGSAQSVSASDDDNDETRHVTNFRTLEVDDMLALSTCA